MCLNYKIYNILVFSCKTIQIVSANLTYNENGFLNSPYYIDNEFKKEGNFKCFFSSEKEKYSPGINKKGGGNYDNYKDSTTSKKNINITYSKDGTHGENSQNIESGLKIEFTPFLCGTTDKKGLKKGISKQKSGTNENNNGNNEGIIEEVENETNENNNENNKDINEEGGNDNIIKKLNFDDVDSYLDVDDNLKLENCITEDNNIKLNNKGKVINGKTQQIIKTETNNRCCCCQ